MPSTATSTSNWAEQQDTQAIVTSLESESVTHLSETERDTLIRLLRKVYQPAG